MVSLKKLVALGLVGSLAGLLVASQGQEKPPFRLTVVHTNDTHAHHEPQDDGKGDGGDARAAAVIRQIRQSAPNPILLDAGDRFTGTLFQWKYKGLEHAPIMNMLNYQAMTLGNHEFDEGPDGLTAFVEKLNFPVVCANLDVAKLPRLAAKLKPYVVLDVAGQAVGIIGVTTVDAKLGSKPGPDIGFDANYAARVQAAADELAAKGVTKVLVLSHLGLGEDKKLAAAGRGIDAIIGGHSHTLLSRTYAEAKGPYPVRVVDKAGVSVPIVQAGGGDNRYLGRLDLEFDAAGLVTKAGGDTVLLSRFITPEKDIQDEVTRLAEPIRALKDKPALGPNGQPIHSIDALSNKDARDEEAPLGNLLADALRDRAGSDVGFMLGGGIRAGLPQGELTYGTIYKMLPFTNNVCRIKLRGADVRAALENGASRYGGSGNGRLLHASGLRYTLNVTKPVGQRVTSVEVLTASGPVPLDDAKTYTVACDSYSRTGGDDFTMFRDRVLEADDDLGPIQDVVIRYLGSRPGFRAQREGRLTVVK